MIRAVYLSSLILHEYYTREGAAKAIGGEKSTEQT